MNLDHPIFILMYSVAIRDSSLLLGVEYCWHILPKVSFYIFNYEISEFVSEFDEASTRPSSHSDSVP